MVLCYYFLYYDKANKLVKFVLPTSTPWLPMIILGCWKVGRVRLEFLFFEFQIWDKDHCIKLTLQMKCLKPLCYENKIYYF